MTLGRQNQSLKFFLFLSTILTYRVFTILRPLPRQQLEVQKWPANRIDCYTEISCEHDLFSCMQRMGCSELGKKPQFFFQHPVSTFDFAPFLPRLIMIYFLAFEDWPFLSVHFWGEDPTGEWTLGKAISLIFELI